MYKNDIFRLFEIKKKYENMLQNASSFSACPRTPLTNALRSHASQAPPPPNNSWPPLANPAYAHELVLRNLSENPPWQTVDCVLYVICLCITQSF